MTTAIEKRLLERAKEERAVIVSGDALINLLTEMERLRRKVDNLQQEVQRNFDTAVEHIPAVTEDGGIQFKVFNADMEDQEVPYKRVTFKASSVAVVEDW